MSGFKGMLESHVVYLPHEEKKKTVILTASQVVIKQKPMEKGKSPVVPSAKERNRLSAPEVASPSHQSHKQEPTMNTVLFMIQQGCLLDG